MLEHHMLPLGTQLLVVFVFGGDDFVQVVDFLPHRKQLLLVIRQVHLDFALAVDLAGKLLDLLLLHRHGCFEILQQACQILALGLDITILVLD